MYRDREGGRERQRTHDDHISIRAPKDADTDEEQIKRVEGGFVPKARLGVVERGDLFRGGVACVYGLDYGLSLAYKRLDYGEEEGMG